MDIHQKISIGIFGTLLLGTMALYSTGGLTSNVLNSDNVATEDLCSDTFIKKYADVYESDKKTLANYREFIYKNCRGEVVESKKSYCDARKKQVTTYSKQVKRYEDCMSGEVAVKE